MRKYNFNGENCYSNINVEFNASKEEISNAINELKVNYANDSNVLNNLSVFEKILLDDDKRKSYDKFMGIIAARSNDEDLEHNNIEFNLNGQDFYDMIDIDVNASNDEINKKINLLIKKYKGDEKISSKLKEISSILLDNEKRAIYDDKIGIETYRETISEKLLLWLKKHKGTIIKTSLCSVVIAASFYAGAKSNDNSPSIEQTPTTTSTTESEESTVSDETILETLVSAIQTISDKNIKQIQEDGFDLTDDEIKALSNKLNENDELENLTDSQIISVIKKNIMISEVQKTLNEDYKIDFVVDGKIAEQLSEIEIVEYKDFDKESIARKIALSMLIENIKETINNDNENVNKEILSNVISEIKYQKDITYEENIGSNVSKYNNEIKNLKLTVDNIDEKVDNVMKQFNDVGLKIDRQVVYDAMFVANVDKMDVNDIKAILKENNLSSFSFGSQFFNYMSALANWHVEQEENNSNLRVSPGIILSDLSDKKIVEEYNNKCIYLITFSTEDFNDPDKVKTFESNYNDCYKFHVSQGRILDKTKEEVGNAPKMMTQMQLSSIHAEMIENYGNKMPDDIHDRIMGLDAGNTLIDCTGLMNNQKIIENVQMEMGIVEEAKKLQ